MESIATSLATPRRNLPIIVGRTKPRMENENPLLFEAADPSTTNYIVISPKLRKGLPPKSPSPALALRLSPSPNQAQSSRWRSTRKRGSKKDSSSIASVASTESLCSSQDFPERNGHCSDGEHERRSQALVDPSPRHLNVAGDGDDFCSTADLNTVSFNAKASSRDRPNPLNDVDTNVHQDKAMKYGRSKSWDASTARNPRTRNKSCSKLCMQVPSIFRRQRVGCTDVASLSNASDTVVMVENNGGRISGRELHERAKAVLNSGDYTQAAMMFEALQKAQVERFGDIHSSVGAATHNVGIVRLRMGQPSKAELILERAVDIRREVLGNDHLDLAASLSKLGSARILLRRFDDGLRVLREALRITKTNLGPWNKSVAQIFCHIGCLHFEASELSSAQRTFEEALEIYREILPLEPDRDACMAQLTETICSIGSIQNKRKKFPEAMESFQEALDLQRDVYGHDHPRVVACLDNLGFSFSKMKLYHQALACYKEMLTSQVSHFGFFNLECCETLKKQVIIYEKLKDISGAIKATKKALVKIHRDTPIPLDSVSYEVEQMLMDLKVKRCAQQGEF